MLGFAKHLNKILTPLASLAEIFIPASTRLFIMNDALREKLREKLLLFRARKYADKLNGINHYSISLLNDGDFAWHRQELSKSYSLSFKGEIVYDHPITADDLIQSIMTLLG